MSQDPASVLPAVPQGPLLTDSFGRTMSYLRLSVTDRCDLRCVYCMAEHMCFVSHRDLLTLEELYRLSAVFMRHGVRKIRITGGEPLVRKNIMCLFEMLSRHIKSGELDELVLTTNGTQLPRFAGKLHELGLRRINVSLDSLDPERYRTLTRGGDVRKALAGLDAAQEAGLKIKLNSVAMRGEFEREVDHLIDFAHGRGMDLTLIEEMPLGDVHHDRAKSFLPLDKVRKDLESRWTLVPIEDKTGGPARYVRIEETGGRLGLITPLSCDFCASCNRLRVSCTGELFTCLGKDSSVSLREALRGSSGDEQVETQIFDAVAHKPECHNLSVAAEAVSGIGRHMSVLGG
ncbi:cyclic pyranopterin monophosphate synthase subunit MoaA [Breoghania corrubedonensis]|uniref:GTP 3',8-cyclase n=1 Tax=Breoghania corrubedonensis TaxID=665038 RepID=A0A2T5VBG1_9HYPH|nr:GTP 3',8-cyclase MoaA [Breoghania corrubedonensis]PTW61096.1 cyclic pyranopterin monophosphate synthase subunit MoaA [Breoghania corrubedonensis]